MSKYLLTKEKFHSVFVDYLSPIDNLKLANLHNTCRKFIQLSEIFCHAYIVMCTNHFSFLFLLKNSFFSFVFNADYLIWKNERTSTKSSSNIGLGMGYELD